MNAIQKENLIPLLVVLTLILRDVGATTSEGAVRLLAFYTTLIILYATISNVKI